MNKGNTLLGIIEALSALLVIFLAYLIKYKKKVNLISGYDEQRCKDKDGLANWVGGWLITAGSCCFLLAVLIIVLPNYMNILMIIYGVIIFLGAMIAAIGSSKYNA